MKRFSVLLNSFKKYVDFMVFREKKNSVECPLSFLKFNYFLTRPLALDVLSRPPRNIWTTCAGRY